MSATPHPQGDRSLLRRIFYNREIRSTITQIVVMMLVFALFYEIGTNLLLNLEAIGKEISFGFIEMPASYDITFQPFVDYDPSKSHFWAAMVGLTNTLLVAVSGIILATILGFTLGVMRLSRNFLVSRMSQIFIEFNRNVPVLLHILFLYGVIIHILPKPKQSISIPFVPIPFVPIPFVPIPFVPFVAHVLSLQIRRRTLRRNPHWRRAKRHLRQRHGRRPTRATSSSRA